MKELSQNTKEFVNINNLDFGEGGTAENIIMMVLCDDVFCICLKSAVNKFVVVWICCDETEVIVDLNHHGIRKVEQSLDNVGGNLWPNLLQTQRVRHGVTPMYKSQRPKANLWLLLSRTIGLKIEEGKPD